MPTLADDLDAVEAPLDDPWRRVSGALLDTRVLIASDATAALELSRDRGDLPSITLGERHAPASSSPRDDRVRRTEPAARRRVRGCVRAAGRRSRGSRHATARYIALANPGAAGRTVNGDRPR